MWRNETKRNKTLHKLNRKETKRNKIRRAPLERRSGRPIVNAKHLYRGPIGRVLFVLYFSLRISFFCVSLRSRPQKCHFFGEGGVALAPPLIFLRQLHVFCHFEGVDLARPLIFWQQLHVVVILQAVKYSGLSFFADSYTFLPFWRGGPFSASHFLPTVTRFCHFAGRQILGAGFF